MLNQYKIEGQEGRTPFYRSFGDYGTTDESAIQEARNTFRHLQINSKPGETIEMVLKRESKVIKRFPEVAAK